MRERSMPPPRSRPDAWRSARASSRGGDGRRSLEQGSSQGLIGEMTAVEFRNVTKAFGPVTALDNIVLDVRSGEFATVLGPSGSGKSTLLALLAGIVSPTSG